MKATSDVMLRTNDFAAAKAHYGGALGFPVIVENERLLGFDLGGFVLYFESGEDNGSVFEFEVSDVAQTRDQLLRQGCSLIEENAAIPRCYLRDPFGLTFNLTQTFQ